MYSEPGIGALTATFTPSGGATTEVAFNKSGEVTSNVVGFLKKYQSPNTAPPPSGNNVAS